MILIGIAGLLFLFLLIKCTCWGFIKFCIFKCCRDESTVKSYLNANVKDHKELEEQNKVIENKISEVGVHENINADNQKINPQQKENAHPPKIIFEPVNFESRKSSKFFDNKNDQIEEINIQPSERINFYEKEEIDVEKEDFNIYEGKK